jgi:hypothetical protein
MKNARHSKAVHGLHATPLAAVCAAACMHGSMGKDKMFKGWENWGFACA